MFKTMSYNRMSGSSMNESGRAASSCLSIIMDTVIAVSIFVILGLVISLVVRVELSVIILAIVSVVIVAVLLAVLIIESSKQRRPNAVKAY